MKLLRILFLHVAALSVVGTSQADTLVHTAVFGPAKTEWYTAFFLPQFNPSVGTLTGVDWAVVGRLFAIGETDTPVRVVADGIVAARKPNGQQVASIELSVGGVVNPGQYELVSESGSSSGSIPAGEFAAYIGSGSVFFDAKAYTIFGFGHVMPLDAQQGSANTTLYPAADIELSITYTYTDTVTDTGIILPPPTRTPDSSSTLGLLGAGVLLVGVIRRKCG